MTEASAEAIETALATWLDNSTLVRLQTEPGENLCIEIPIKGITLRGWFICLVSGYVLLVPLGLELGPEDHLDMSRLMAAINGVHPFGSFDFNPDADDVSLRITAFVADAAHVEGIQPDVMGWARSALRSYSTLFRAVADKLLTVDDAITKVKDSNDDEDD